MERILADGRVVLHPVFVYPCQVLHPSTLRQPARVPDLAVSAGSLPTPNLCSICQGFNFETLDPRSGRHQLHNNLAELGECAKTCPLCRHAAHAIRNRDSSHFPRRGWATESGDLSSDYQAGVFYGWPGNYDGGLTIMIFPVDVNIREIVLSSSIHGNCAINWFRVRTFHGDPAERYGIRTVRTVGEYTGSQLTLNHALIWIKECLSSQDPEIDCRHIKNEEDYRALAIFRESQHSSGRADLETPQQGQQLQHESESTAEHQLKCEIDFLYKSRHLSTSQPQGMQTQRPSRLIHITTLPEEIEHLHDTDELDLRLVKTPSIDVAYATLTYTWGTAEPIWRTTKGNVIARQEQLPFLDLPLTLRQAVTMTARLGLRYIWIDSICIVQDDMIEWQRESLLMANVYQNALVTIAADDSGDSHSGLYNTASTSLFNPQESFQIDTMLVNGEKSQLFLFWDVRPRDDDRPRLRDIGDLVNHSKLRDRGWAFQERKLSARILHFAGDQLYWECHHGIIETEDEYTALGIRDTIRKLETRMKGSLTNSEAVKRVQEDLMCHWYTTLVADDYSHRTLTRTIDKLIAISGVAQKIAAIFPSSIDHSYRSPCNTVGDLSYYIAGHFRFTIINSLCWARDGAGGKAPRDTYRAPSWSWASQNSAVNYTTYSLHCSEDAMNAQFLDASFEHERERQWVNVDKDKGWLRLKAKVQPGIIRIDKDHKSTKEEPLPFAFPTDNFSTPSDENCFLTMPSRQYSEFVQLDDDDNDGEEGVLKVHVVMLAEKRGKPSACLICTTVEPDDVCNEYQNFRRIGFVEGVQRYRSAASDPPSDEVDEFANVLDKDDSYFRKVYEYEFGDLTEEEPETIVLF